MLNNQILYEKKNRFLVSLQEYGKLTTLCLSGVQSNCVSSEQAWVLQPALGSVHHPDAMFLVSVALHLDLLVAYP